MRSAVSLMLPVGASLVDRTQHRVKMEVCNELGEFSFSCARDVIG